MSFEVLFVCTGNVCRSPTAELLTSAWAPATTELRAHSAGLAALVGEPVDAGSAGELVRLGVDPGPHRGQQFEPWMALDADLVLTAEQAHADKILRLVPQTFRKVFTLKEFARLVDGLPAAQGPELAVGVAAGRRGFVPVAEPGGDDIADPFRRSPERARQAADEIAAAVRAMLDFVLGTGTPPRRRPKPYPR